MNPRVIEVTPLAAYRLKVRFTNGEQRIFDVSPYLKYPAFRRLSNTAYFALAHPDHGTVAWPDDIDFCPDTVYVESIHEEPESYGKG
jgi:hypothetical protein